jgi:hypothetical protein
MFALEAETTVKMFVLGMCHPAGKQGRAGISGKLSTSLKTPILKNVY